MTNDNQHKPYTKEDLLEFIESCRKGWPSQTVADIESILLLSPDERILFLAYQFASHHLDAKRHPLIEIIAEPSSTQH